MPKSAVSATSYCRERLVGDNHKIVPILLTVLSTICGLIPFLIDGPSERFWFPLAVGSISGLLCSVVALVLVFPLLTRLDNRRGER